MKTTIDKAGRVVIPASAREKAGLEPGAELEVLVDDFSIRLVRTAPPPVLVRRGKRLVARPAVKPSEMPRVDLARMIEEERNRWPW
jgi:AbrB family looped-hinge helix DNA binding protein